MENQIACSSHFTRCCLPAYISHFLFMYCLMCIFKIQANRGKMLSIMRKRSSDLSQPQLAPHPHRPGEVLAPVTSTTAQRALTPPFLSFNPSHHRGESLLLLAQWEPNPIPPKGGSLTQDEWMDFCERPVPSQELVLRCVFTKNSFTCPVLLRIPLRAVVFQ